MLKFYFDTVPDFIDIPDNFRSNSGVIIIGEKDDLFNFFDLEINEYFLKENFLVNYSVKNSDFDFLEKILDFKGAFGQNKYLNYNKSKFYSEKFYIDKSLYYYDVSKYKDFFDENLNLFRSGFSGFCFFSDKLVGDKVKYVFPLDFVNNYYGNIYLNFPENSLDNCNLVKRVDEFLIKKEYLNGAGKVLGIDFYAKYLMVDRNEVMVVKSLS